MLLSKFIRFNSIHGRELHRCLTSKSKYDLFRRNNNNNEEEKKPTFLIFPEIPGETEETNEFLVLPTTGQIPFDGLNVEKCVLASGKLSLEFEHFIDEYSNTLKQEFEDGDVSNAKLNEFIGQMEKHLMPLQYNLNLLSAFKVIRPNEFDFRLFDHFFMQRLAKSRLRFQNRSIYCFMCEMKARAADYGKKEASSKCNHIHQEEVAKTNKLDEERKFQAQQKRQLVDRYIREAKLVGLSLKHQDQLNVYNLVNEKLNKEQQNFITAAMQANSVFQSNIISPQFLDCLPDHVITQLNHHDIDAVFNSFMRYCPDQTLRKDFWLAYNARAAPYLGSNLNNFLSIEKIRELRHQKAQLLGYENFAKMVLDLRGSGCHTMAGNVDNVLAFMNGLGSQSEAKFAKNLQEIKDFAMEFRPEGRRAQDAPSTFMPSNIMIEQLHLWDLKYFERLFLRERYQIDSGQVRAYFQLDRVVAGMFEFAERLFGIKIVEIKDDPNVWGRNVHHFKIFDDSGRSSGEYGSFYFDPFQPKSRIFMPIARSDSLNTKPVVFFLMDFAHRSGTVFDQLEKQKLQAAGKELLNFSQVVQLFGKFGFVLQHLLTQVDYTELGGLANIEVDTFNMVSHFMRLWPLNSYPVIAGCSSHLKTGEPISEEFFDRIRKSYYHFVSFPLKYELYLMALDLNLHTSHDHSTSLLRKTWSEWMMPFEAIEENGHTCSWLDLFKGDGQEGIYYSNKWSEVIAADLFDAFRERDLHNEPAIRQMGERFKDTFMAQTGAIETNELFRRFLGRDPTLNGYLAINGFVLSP